MRKMDESEGRMGYDDVRLVMREMVGDVTWNIVKTIWQEEGIKMMSGYLLRNIEALLK